MPYGSSNVGVVDVPSFSDPGSLGYLGMTYDPNVCTSQTTLNTLQPVLAKVLVPATITISSVAYYAATTPATTLTNFTVAFFHNEALTVDGGQSLTIPGGVGAFVWVAFLSSGATPVTLPRGTSVTAAMANGLLTAATCRSGSLANVIAGNGLPTSFTPSATTLIGVDYWAALA